MNSLKVASWNECKTLIKSSNPEFYNLLADISPSNNMPIYIAKYSYGEVIGDKTDVFLPDEKGGTFKLGNPDTPTDLMQHIGYGRNSIPLGMVISNFCEWYTKDPETKDAYPVAIQGEGTIFNKQIVFQEAEGIENSTISVCSGSRTAFMLPSIGSRINHERIKQIFNLSIPVPKHHQDHHKIFKGIVKSSTWHSTLLFFSEKWINEIKNNEKWVFIKLFLSEQMRQASGKDIYNSFYNDLFMTAKKVNKFRPTPFLVDSAKAIFNIAMNRGCGTTPAIDESKIPLKEIQRAYKEVYELPYTPTIMVPSRLSQSNNTVYYSLQQPSTKINTFKIKLNNSTIRELDALKDILKAYQDEFTKEKGTCYGSELYKTCKDLTLGYYHNLPSIKGIIHSKKIIDSDERFSFSYSNHTNFPIDAKFFKGCIKISR